MPDTGLYDTVYDWDMSITFATGATMTFAAPLPAEIAALVP